MDSQDPSQRGLGGWLFLQELWHYLLPYDCTRNFVGDIVECNWMIRLVYLKIKSDFELKGVYVLPLQTPEPRGASHNWKDIEFKESYVNGTRKKEGHEKSQLSPALPHAHPKYYFSHLSGKSIICKPSKSIAFPCIMPCT